MFSLLLSFLLTLFFVVLIKPLAIRLNLVDEPGGRKQHDGAIPLIGGIAIFLGFHFGLLTLNISLLPYRPLIAASALLIIVGVLDDFHELSTRSRLFAQILAASLMVFLGKNILIHLGNIFGIGNFALGILGLPLTIFATVGIINSVNMLDGLDGLAGSQAFLILSFFDALAFHYNQLSDCVLLSLLIASLLAFLFFNFPYAENKRARIFLGDAGSMFIGFILCWFAVSFTQGQTGFIRPITVLWIFLVPIFDTLRLLIQRTLLARSPFQPGRDHLHHLLVERGYSQVHTTWLMGIFTFCSGLIACASQLLRVPEFLSLL